MTVIIMTIETWNNTVSKVVDLRAEQGASKALRDNKIDARIDQRWRKAVIVARTIR